MTSSTLNKGSNNTKDNTGRWVYFLDHNNNLAQVVSPTGIRTGYQYNDPYDKHNLTEKFSYNDKSEAQLITQWQYDPYDRAISSTHKDGIEKVSVVFDNDTVIPTQAGHIFTNRLTNSVGETTDYRYQYKKGEAQLLSVIGAGCVTCGPSNVSYEYDNAGRVTKISQLDSRGQTISSMGTEFDAHGRVKTERSQIVDQPSNNQSSSIHYEYVSNNPENNRFHIVAKEWQSSVAIGKQTGVSYTHNDHGRPTEKTEFGYTPDGKAISRSYLMSYDNKGNLTQVVLRDESNPESIPIVIEAYTWFEDGSIKTTEQPHLNTKTSFTHNAAGLTTQIDRQIGAENTTIKFSFDNNNLPISMSRYLNDELINGVNYQRNHTGDITSVTDLEDNFIASYAYDDARRNLGEITAKKASLRHLDTEGRPIVDYNITANTTDKLSYIYDDKNRISAVGRDDTQLVAVNYSEDNKIAQILGASGEQTFVDNKDSQFNDYSLPNVWDTLGVKKTTVKSVRSGVTQVEQNNNLTTDYGIDDFGRIAYIDSQTAGRNNYQYDARDQLTGIELANGVKISFKYDDKGRQVHKSVTQEGEVVQQVTWEFDAQDQLVAANGSNQQIAYHYDKQGRVIQKRLTLADLATPLVTSYNYDKDGNMTGITLPDGIGILSNNDQIRYKAPDDIKAKAIYSQSTHQAVGMNQISYELGQHIVMGHYYDDNGRFSGLSYRNRPNSGGNPLIRSARADDITPLFSQQWQRTDDGIVEQVTELDYQTKPIEHNYLYDSQYHLVSSSYQTVELDKDFTQVATTVKQGNDQTNNDINSARYIYDELGNRMLGIDDSKTLKKYQYDDSGRLTTITPIAQTTDSQNVSAQSIAYDAAGLPTEYGDYQLNYSAGQLSQIKGKDGQLIAQYTYNDEGQRIKKVVYQKDNTMLASPQTSYYVYEDSQLQHELDSQGNIIRHYLYVGDTLTATMDYPKGSHGKLLTLKQPSISLWQRTSNWVSQLWNEDTAYPTINYIITDYLGRPRQVRDGETNALKWQLTPTLFGGNVDTELQQQSDYQLNMRFPGQYEDVETGLYYNHWRYYDQDTGRYLSADPLGLSGGENLYAYVNATPTHFIDPPGLLLFAFDGMGNQDYGAGTSLSNVVKFRDAYRADVNEPNMFKKDGIKKINGQSKQFGSFAEYNAFYISGAGTYDRYSGITAPTGDGGFGQSIVDRVYTMVNYLHTYLEFIESTHTGKNKPKTPVNIDLDVVGFSRGAASARMFVSQVNALMNGTLTKNKIYGPYGASRQKTWHDNPTPWKYNQAWLKSNCNVNFNFNFMGLWDTVPSYGTSFDNDVADMKKLGMSLSIPSKFKKVVHAVAVNEHRAQFHNRSIFEDQAQATKFANSANRVERGFLGAHSDIGGGYQEGDLSDVSLMWVIQEAKKAGIDFDSTLIKNKGWDKVTNPIVHDSLSVELSAVNFTPGRELRWVGRDVKEGDGPLQSANFNHLKFNWQNSLQFQPLNGNARRRVFQQIRDLSIEFDNNNNPACGQLGFLCDEQEAIYALKGIDKDKTKDNEFRGNQTIVYGKDANGRIVNGGYIDIVGYVNWLKTSGYYGGLSELSASKP